ncbi:MAG: hypothetical protein GY719_41935 [bacterium]|nr:hypothetical protein [bacterium]
MNLLALIRDFFLSLAERWERMKPERVQNRDLPGDFEVPMTSERIEQRAVETGFEVVWAPVAIRRRYYFANFGEATAFADIQVAAAAERSGQIPRIEITGNAVDVIAGIPIPNLLSEGDFDFAADLVRAVEASSDSDTDTD